MPKNRARKSSRDFWTNRTKIVFSGYESRKCDETALASLDPELIKLTKQIHPRHAPESG